MGGKKTKRTQQQRIETQQRLWARVRTRPASMSGHSAQDDEPPPEAIQAYAEVFQWAAEHPDEAADLACYDESDWAGPMAGIAFPEVYQFPQQQVIKVAWQFRAWHILNGMKYTLDWPTPIAVMGEDEIIAQLRADGAAGKIPLPGS